MHIQRRVLNEKKLNFWQIIDIAHAIDTIVNQAWGCNIIQGRFRELTMLRPDLNVFSGKRENYLKRKHYPCESAQDQANDYRHNASTCLDYGVKEHFQMTCLKAK